jgi:hypothetical protein
MPPTLRKHRLSAGALLLALASAACSDQANTPVAPDPAVPPPALAAVMECHADVRAGVVVCGDAANLSEGARGLIVGGQPNNIRLTSSSTTFTADTFAFNMTVQNLIAQPMATTDGTTASASGVRAFFHAGPTTTSGSGTVTVANADGTGTFTGSAQPYHQYSGTMLGSDGILSQNEVSSLKRWKFHMPSTVLTFSFTAYVSTDVPLENGWVDVAPVNPMVMVGATRALTATGRSGTGAVISGHTVNWSSGNTGVATVNSSGVVTGVAPGVATITATSTDGLRTGSTTVRVCPDLGLAVGGVAVLTMPADAAFCLGGGASGAEYTVVPVNVGGSFSLTVTATGIVPVTGAPRPTLLGGGAQALPTTRVSALDAARAYELRLREREAVHLTPLISATSQAFRARRAGPGARRAITPGVPTVGALMPLNVESTGSCTASSVRTGRVEVVGSSVIVMSDTSNPAGGITTAGYQAIANRFDSLVWPTLTSSFGAPEDIDGNGRVIVFYTTEVNARTPTGQPPVTHGYTLRRDLFFSSSCSTSNEGEMIYMAAADPAGTINGNARSAASVDSFATRTMAREMEYLINSSRRLYVNYAPEFEIAWFDNALAQVAQELVFYAASGKQPRQNLGFADVTSDSVSRAAFLAYAEPNYAILRGWLRTPEIGAADAAWAWLRYSADRKGGTESAFWYALVNSTTTGFLNYEDAIGTPRDPWIRDFFMSLYADDAMSGVPAAYTVPSWSFRSLYDALDYDGDRLADGYPLAARNPANGVPSTFPLSSNGASYVRLGVAASGVAEVNLQNGSAAPSSTLLVTVVRRK